MSSGFGKSYLLVKRAVSLALDRGTDRAKEMVAVLLEALADDRHQPLLPEDDDIDDDIDGDIDRNIDRTIIGGGSGSSNGSAAVSGGGVSGLNVGFLTNSPRAGGGSMAAAGGLARCLAGTRDACGRGTRRRCPLVWRTAGGSVSPYVTAIKYLFLYKCAPDPTKNSPREPQAKAKRDNISESRRRSNAGNPPLKPQNKD